MAAEKKAASKQPSADYGAKDIQVLEGLDPVRKRPGMYIGSTGLAGLHHLIWEVVDNSIDEAMAGFATRVGVTLLADGGITKSGDIVKALTLAQGAVMIDPDLRSHFPDSDAVNRALRSTLPRSCDA